MTPLHLDDPRLVERARRGDQAAFVELVDRYQAPVYNLCYRLLGEPAEAEDAAQEAFLRAYHHLPAYDPHRSFKTWLLSIAGHYCIDRLRRRHWHWLSLDEDALPPHPALREPALGPEEAAARREQADAVQELLDQLAPRDRRLVVLYYWHELPLGEIARVTGDSVSAVKSRLHRARGQMAQLLGTHAAGQPLFAALRP
ncbi:MAG: sigma-70 family RNA polymerase sigma factor [Anaerolineales bacterium]|nr:sigma-70 family RNA polymerase sigma factor [Anaerolineales bacterium]